jgi:hypothetical protein
LLQLLDFFDSEVFTMEWLNEAMKKHLQECGLVAAGRDLILWTKEGQQFTLPLPPDLWSPLPAQGEEWLEGVHWSCGIDELLVLFYRQKLPMDSEFFNAATRILEFVDIRVVASAARYIHDFVSLRTEPQGLIQLYMVAPQGSGPWVELHPDLKDKFQED